MDEEKMLSFFDIKLREIVSASGKDVNVFNPKIISIDKNIVKFGMFKHYGVLNIPLNLFFDPN